MKHVAICATALQSEYPSEIKFPWQAPSEMPSPTMLAAELKLAVDRAVRVRLKFPCSVTQRSTKSHWQIWLLYSSHFGLIKPHRQRHGLRCSLHPCTRASKAAETLNPNLARPRRLKGPSKTEAKNADSDDESRITPKMNMSLPPRTLPLTEKSFLS